MGAVYDIELSLAYTDKSKATQALATYVDKCIERGVRFGCDKDTSSINSMMDMLLAGHQGGFDHPDCNDGFDNYYSGFTATYSWSEILDDMFETLLPYLTDSSYYYQSCDEDYDEYTTKNGKKMLVSSSWRQ